jgi:MGT family glycosyltransferase
MSRFLFVTWDGAGNLVPTLGIAGALARRGHDVRLLGHRSIDERVGGGGWRFRPFSHADALDAGTAHGTSEMAAMAEASWFNGALAEDVRDELARESADAVIVDCMLFAGMSAAQAWGIPTAALFHGAFALFRGGPLVDMLSRWVPDLNAVRDRFGLPRVARLADVHDACALSVAATPREFEPPIPVPSNVRFAGPILDGPALVRTAGSAPEVPASEPLALVSFSTSQQRQLSVLRRIVDALGAVAARAVVTTGPAVDPSELSTPANVDVVQFVPHDRLLTRASLVITHAGLGTVMAALAHGVPLLCMPMGRDQFFNAARVEALGAGRTLAADASVDVIADAVRAGLADGGMRTAAGRMQRAIAAYNGGAAAIEEIERLATSPTAPTSSRARADAPAPSRTPC